MRIIKIAEDVPVNPVVPAPVEGEKDYGFLINPYQLGLAKAILADLNKRATKAGLPLLTMKEKEVQVKEFTREGYEGGQYREPMPTGKMKTMIEITVHGQSPIIAGWEFIARIDHIKDDEGKYTNVVSKVDQNVVVPESYQTAKPECDHCTKDRQRLKTYLLKKVDGGELKQIGSTCIDKFLPRGANNIEMLFNALNQFANLGGGEEEGEGGGGGRRGADIYTVVAISNCLVRQMGYQKSAPRGGDEYGPSAEPMKTPTRVYVDGLLAGGDWAKDMRNKLGKMGVNPLPTPEDYITAMKAVQWAKDLTAAETTGNDYLANLHGASNLGLVSGRFMGVVVSLAATYKREMDKKNRVFADPPFVGKIGENLSIEVTIESTKEARGGASMLYVGMTQEGQKVKWWGNPALDAYEVGKSYKVNGVVKVQETDKYMQGWPVTELVGVKLEGAGDKEPPKFVGEVGKMVNLTGIKVVDEKKFTQTFGRQTTISTLYTLVDSNGSRLKGFVTDKTGIDLEIGKIYSMRVKIKSHDPMDKYDNMPVTVFQMMKNVEETGASAAYTDKKLKAIRDAVEMAKGSLVALLAAPGKYNSGQGHGLHTAMGYLRDEKVQKDVELLGDEKLKNTVGNLVEAQDSLWAVGNFHVGIYFGMQGSKVQEEIVGYYYKRIGWIVDDLEGPVPESGFVGKSVSHLGGLMRNAGDLENEFRNAKANGRVLDMGKAALYLELLKELVPLLKSVSPTAHEEMAKREKAMVDEVAGMAGGIPAATAPAAITTPIAPVVPDVKAFNLNNFMKNGV